MKLRIRTSAAMIELSEEESGELRNRLRELPAAQPAEETIAVSANASTSVTFTSQQKAAVLEVLDLWLEKAGPAAGDGPTKLRDALRVELNSGQ